MKVQRIQLNEANINELMEKWKNLSYEKFIKNHKDIVKAWLAAGLPTDNPQKYYETLNSIAEDLDMSDTPEKLTWDNLFWYPNKYKADAIDQEKPQGDLKSKVNSLLTNINKASKEEILEVIKHAASRVGQGEAIENNLSKTSEKTLRSFVVAMGEDELMNTNSRVWTGFSNSSAGELLSDDNVFVLFYNLLIDKYLKYTNEYLKNEKSILYNKNLYYNVQKTDDRESLLELDISGNIDNEKLNNAINTGTFSKYISDSNLRDFGYSNKKNKQLADDTKNMVKNSDKKETIKFISDVFGVDPDKAEQAYNNLVR